MLATLIVGAAGCGSMTKMGKIEQSIAPEVDGRKFRRLTLIAAGPHRGDRQVLARARDRLTAAGVTLVKRPGEWATNADALRDICVQRPEGTDNVDGVVFVTWDNLSLHECGTGVVATSISGGYAGIDAMVDRLIRYMGVTPPTAEQK
jgi:hypothetical protein